MCVLGVFAYVCGVCVWVGGVCVCVCVVFGVRACGCVSGVCGVCVRACCEKQSGNVFYLPFFAFTLPQMV